MRPRSNVPYIIYVHYVTWAVIVISSLIRLYWNIHSLCYIREKVSRIEYHRVAERYKRYFVNIPVDDLISRRKSGDWFGKCTGSKPVWK